MSKWGRCRVAVEIVSRSGGEIVVSEGREGEPVLDMPAFAADTDSPRSVTAVTATSPADPLAPGEAAFIFGPDFRLDRESSGTEVQNGDNLMQRGLASDPSEYKIELDRGRPACRIKGGVRRLRSPRHDVCSS